MENQSGKRTVLMISGAMDSLLGAIGLLIYFDVLPFDMAGWGIPRWVLGLVGAGLFFSGIAIFTYYFSKTDVSG